MLSGELVQAHDMKIASVDAGKIFSHWDYTIRFEDKVVNLRKSIDAKDKERIAAIKRLIQKQRDLSAKYQEAQGKISGEQKAGMDESYKNLGREIKALQRDRLDYKKREMNRLKEMEQSTSQLILKRIHEAVQVFAKQHNYDMVIESKGETTANLPFFLHLEGAVDITDTIIMQLNQSNQPNPNQ
ncbi:MAG: OmpH family outer membrane protein [Akkermansiaceae bacterium]|nr:OmpH family outer membrane protein [Akkermansiaceae bacterium]